MLAMIANTCQIFSLNLAFAPLLASGHIPIMRFSGPNMRPDCPTAPFFPSFHDCRTICRVHGILRASG